MQSTTPLPDLLDEAMRKEQVTRQEKECAVGKKDNDSKENDVTGIEADDLEGLYRSFQVNCGVMCREVPRT